MKTTNSILSFIPYGKQNAITRETLCAYMELPDAEIRRQIRLARTSGELILNDQDGLGYYQVNENDVDMIARQYKQDYSRALSILKRCKRMRRILRNAGRL